MCAIVRRYAYDPAAIASAGQAQAPAPELGLRGADRANVNVCGIRSSLWRSKG